MNIEFEYRFVLLFTSLEIGWANYNKAQATPLIQSGFTVLEAGHGESLVGKGLFGECQPVP